MYQSWSQFYRDLDTLLRRGQVVANVDADGDVVYRSQEVATDAHRRNGLRVEEVRVIRRSAQKLSQNTSF